MIKIPSLKTIGIVVIILILAYAWGVTQYALKQKEQRELAETERDQAVSFATQQKEEVTRYKNAYNNEVARVKDTQITLDNVNRLIETKELSWLKQFESLNRKYKNLERAASIAMSVNSDSIKVITVTAPCENDSIKLFRYYIHDEYNFIDAVVLDTPDFEIRVPLHIAYLWERKKFLGLRIGKKEYFNEVVSPNKLISIDSLVSYTTGRRGRKK